jgi:3-phenylpropionate/trans-cinnamate dioxygenase ferredoxin reductase subunit
MVASGTTNQRTLLNTGVVIVGAGLAGGNAAVALRDGGYRDRIVLVGDEPGIPFGRPPLSKTYLRGEEGLQDWYVRPESWYAEHGVERKLTTVVALDPSGREVRLATTERIAFDRLLIATGGRNRRLQVRGADLDGVFSLRTVAECEAVKAAAHPGQRAVVVGMGFIGSEVTASLRQLGVEVTAVSAGAGPLAGVLGSEVAAVMAGIHREKGVDLVTGDRAEAFTGDDGHVQAVLTAKGARLACDFAVVGAGIEPAVDLLKGTGIVLDNGIVVDSRCRASAAHVFAAGDVANHDHPVFGRLRVEHYNNAERQGRAAARSMLGAEDAYDDIHSFWSDQYEHKIEYVGHARRWDRFVVRGSVEQRSFLAFYLDDGGVRAVLGFNRGGDPEVDTDGDLAAAKVLVRDGTRIATEVLEDESAPLAELANA